MSKALCVCFVAAAFVSKASAEEKDAAPDVQIVVFIHHPGAIKEKDPARVKEQCEASEQDEKLILKSIKDEKIGFDYRRSRGGGHELSIHARDLRRWKIMIDKLHKVGSLKFYDHWGIYHKSYGLVVAYASEMAAKKEGCPDVRIVVFRSNISQPIPKKGMTLDEQEEVCKADEKLILKLAEDLQSEGSRFSGGVGSGFELVIHARDLGRWKDGIDKLHKAGSLKYYDHWGINGNGYGLIPITKPK